MTLTSIALLLAGLALLTAGADLVVRGASDVAKLAGVSPLLIGLTLVSLGTSAPEIAVSVEAAAMGRGGVSLGNVVGSNIFNVFLILGCSALITPLAVDRQLVRLDVPVLIFVSLLPLLLGLDLVLSRVEGGALLGLGVVYSSTLVLLGLREREADDETTANVGDGSGTGEPGGDPDEGGAETATEAEGDDEPAPRGAGARIALDVAMMAFGLVGLVVGAGWLVTAATSIATALGVSELVIGLTVVAASTSLPEMATSVIAAVRGERDLAVGNVVGSNIFNVLIVLGAAGVVAPGGLSVPIGALTFDLPVMLAVAVVCLPIFFTGLAISRWEGAFFVAYYALYIVYLVLDASTHEAEDAFGTAVLFGVVPLTILLALVGWTRGRSDDPVEGGVAASG